MNQPSEDKLLLASMVLVEIAEDWDRQRAAGDSLREVAEYLLNLSIASRVGDQKASA